MITLDRYIARQYAANVLALLLLLFSFVVAIDAILNVDAFLKQAEDTLGPGAGLIRTWAVAGLLVADLWWPRLLQLYSFVIGLVLVGAMGFTFTQLVRHREMVAMLAGGVSLFRAARPVLVVALVMTVLNVINQEVVLSHPRIAPLLTRQQGDAGRRDWSEFRVALTSDGGGAGARVFMASRFDPVTNTLEDLNVWERDEQGRGKRFIVAERATWTPEPGPDGLPGRWVLVRPRMTSLRMAPAGSPQEFVPDAGGVPGSIRTALDPATLLFKRYAAFSQSLSWKQIGGMLESPRLKPEMRDRLQRTRWGRVSTILCAFLSLLITMPFFLVREPTNMLVQSLKCAPVGIISLLGGVFWTAVEFPGLPPGFAVFLPVFLLIAIAIAVLSSLRT